MSVFAIVIYRRTDNFVPDWVVGDDGFYKSCLTPKTSFVYLCGAEVVDLVSGMYSEIVSCSFSE